MKYSVSKTAKNSGVSIRTLHYYDEIGLLSPSIVSDTGYRYYDENNLEKLQQILFFKELDFSLKEITEIMNSPEYIKEKALRSQRELLVLKQKRIKSIIKLLDESLKGDKTMNFNEFDISEIEEAKSKYANEVRERWGATDPYKESNKKTSKYTKEDWERINRESGEIFSKFSNSKDKETSSQEIKNLVKEWQDFITEYYYDCTDEILKGLGEMYVADERFKKNIDRYGEGTAEFMSRAIREY